jgi:hypothetical protein
VSLKKPTLGVKEVAIEQPMENAAARPKNLSANRIPSEGYVLEIDGKFKSQFETSEAAMKAALELKNKYPPIQVNVYDAKAHTRTLVALEKSAVSA